MSTMPPVLTPRRHWINDQNFNDFKLDSPKSLDDVKQLELFVSTGKVYKSTTQVARTLNDSPTQTHAWHDTYLKASLAFVSSRLAASIYTTEHANRFDRLIKSVQYGEVVDLLDYAWLPVFEGRFGRKLRMMSARSSVGIAGIAALVGDLKTMNRMLHLGCLANDGEYIIPVDHSAYLWMIELWCVSQGVPFTRRIKPLHELTEGLLKVWDTPDVELIAAWVEQLCNLHTLLSGAKTYNRQLVYHSHIPIEVFLLYRLREQRGLPNPEHINHPLMQFEWSKLWPIMTQEAPRDELLQGVLDRLEQDEGITIEQLRAPFEWQAK